MQRIARRRIGIATAVLTGGFVSILSMAAAVGPASGQCGIDAQLVSPGQMQRPAGSTPSEPATHSFGIHQDTPAARDDLLKKRALTEGAKVPTEVAPLKAQTISPPAQSGQ
jgi:hypothetical protein